MCSNNEVCQEIKVGQVYKHYKGTLYKVLAIAIDTESGIIDDPTHVPDSAKRVIYYAIGKEDIIWDRPYSMFVGMVDNNGIIQKRFALSILQIGQ
ncbi:MAG TPA: DUF1653 domain-containing protein [Candidatus Babeliales bacterium]|jgi:hypothetical protein|nr:DUF1653 domain-containing protein [Candidatus Babeliales bacterium]